MGVLDMFSLAGQTSVVTGANRGIGRALADALAEAGSDVVLLVRRAELAEPVTAELRDLGVRAEAVVADVTRPGEGEAAVQAIVERYGRVDVLVNNAGFCIHRPALEVTPEDWRAVMDVNVDGVWNCAQAFGRQMVAQGSGAIINIGSISGQIVNRPQWQPGYNASKAAVHQLTKSLAAEWAPYGVRVNALAPGYIKTEMAPVDEPQFRRHWIEDAPMQRYALPAELGPSVVYLASAASGFVTGEVLVIDGGYTLF
jgi:NAD(P)-dependent dehydrogenase (short-subunit alcohol dehydrogenase family)